MEAVAWFELAGKHLVVEEKQDGANCGISFPDGKLHLQSRGHYLRGGPREKQFDLLKQWSACHAHAFSSVLGSRYVVYGEWMFAKHTFFYDALPHYFMEFDVLDTETNTFLDTPSRKALLTGLPIVSVHVIDEGVIASLGHMAGLITRSNFITPGRRERWDTNFLAACYEAKVSYKDSIEHTDPSDDMEGLYVKWEEDGIVKGRYKYVRESFTSSIAGQEEHWHDRPIIQNQLLPGAYERMFET